MDAAAGTNFTFGGITGTNSFALTNSANQAIALTIGSNNQNQTYNGVLYDYGKGASLVKVGTGMQTLATWTNAYGSNSAGGAANGNTVSMTVYGTQANNWTGGTTIDAGTLQIASYTNATDVYGRMPLPNYNWTSWSNTIYTTYQRFDYGQRNRQRHAGL